MPLMLYDLHTHSNASDGALSPDELLESAAAHGVTTLSITDHDTVNAYQRIDRSLLSDITLIAGIELSTTWMKRGIHIVGLNIDPANTQLLDGIAQQELARDERARTIGKRLLRLGIDDAYEAARELAGDAVIGRPHFARHLVNVGKVDSLQSAFKRYLGTGKPGDVRSGWASLGEVIDWISAAGGTAVLAHPLKYKMTYTKLTELLREFKALGGRGVEVVCGQQEANITKRLAGIVSDLDLLASCGSDFHTPDNQWSRPGRYAALPADLNTVWDEW